MSEERQNLTSRAITAQTSETPALVGSSMERFLRGYSAPATKTVYRSWLTKWANLNGFKNDVDNALEAVKNWAYDQGILRLGKNEAFVPKTERKLNAYESITAFVNSDIAPASKLGGKSTIRLFLVRNGIPLPHEDMREQVTTKIRLYRLTTDRVPTPDELRNILLHGSLRLKAVVGIMATGGLRVGELSLLRVGWISWGNGSPTSILIPAQITKAKKKRVTFITSEIAKLLREYLEKVGKLQDLNTEIFAGDPKALIRNITDLLKKLGLRTKNPGSRGYEIHVHCFRKYFYTRLQNAGMPQGLIDVLVGHETPLAQGYGRTTDEEKAREYAKFEGALAILTPIHQESTEKECCRMARDLAVQLRLTGEDEAHEILFNSLRNHHPEMFAELSKRAGKAAVVAGDTLLSQSWNDYERKHWVLQHATLEELFKINTTATASAKDAETKRFSNHEYDYIKTTIGSDDYDQALIAGYQPASQNGSMAYLRKARQQS